jgi:hypothetical protein
MMTKIECLASFFKDFFSGVPEGPRCELRKSKFATRPSGPSVVASRLTSEGGKPSGFTLSDWPSWSFTGLPYFSEISVVYQAFSDKSDKIPGMRIALRHLANR